MPSVTNKSFMLGLIILDVIILGAIMLDVIMLGVIMLCVIMLDVIILIVVAPKIMNLKQALDETGSQFNEEI
jgi:hypothetical protein